MDYYDELLDSDWMGRDPEEYTYRKKGVGVGWEDDLASGDAFSKYLVRVDSDNIGKDKKIQYTKSACSTIVSAMNYRNENIKLIFSEDFENYRQDNTLCVTLEPLSKLVKFPSFNHALDPILGYAVHEMAHLLYTDDDYRKYIQSFTGKEQQLKATIMNILEDERIESLVNDIYRGYTNYIGKAKDYCFGAKLQLEKKMSNVDEVEPINQLFQTFLYLLRYPKALTREYVNTFESEVKLIQSILTPYPTDSKELGEATDEIYKVFESFFNQNKEEEEDQGQGDDSDNSDSSQAQSGTEDSESSEGSQGGDSENKTENSDNSTGEQENSDQKDDAGKGDNSDDDSSGKSMEKPTDTGSDKDLVDSLKQLIEAIDNSEMQTGDSNKVASIIGGGGAVKKAIRDFSLSTEEDDTSIMSLAHTYPPESNLRTSELNVKFVDMGKRRQEGRAYSTSLSTVKSYASRLRATLKKLNRNHTVVNRGLYEGDFDDGLLVDAIIGSKTTYKEEIKYSNRGACIVLLIDESYSMSGANSKNAQDIAVLFERALEGVNNTDFFCYGHTTGEKDATIINMYYEGRKKSKREVLGKIHYHNTNRDGHAIVETTARVRQQIPKDLPIIMFMISDGMPSASVPTGYNKKTYTKKCVDTVEKFSNTQVIHIAIESGIPSKDMFNTFIEFTDPTTLVNDIGKMLKKIITKQQIQV